MPQLCRVCTSDQRKAIDLAIAQRTPMAQIAEAFDVTASSVQRHASNHVFKALAEKVERVKGKRGEVAPLTDILDVDAEMQKLYMKTLGVLTFAEEKGSIREKTAALRECRETLRYCGQLQGLFRDGSVTIDARQQTIQANISQLSTEDLRVLAEAHRLVSDVPALTVDYREVAPCEN